MGSIRKLDDNADIQAFPGAKFEIVGDVPAPQCSEAKIESITGIIDLFLAFIDDVGKFTGYNLIGKQVTVTSPPPDVGTWGITANTNDRITTDHTFNTATNACNYYVHNGGELILTRNIQSFAEFIHAAGYAYTIKGGKLYTNIPNGQLKDACTILFDPLP